MGFPKVLTIGLFLFVVSAFAEIPPPPEAPQPGFTSYLTVLAPIPYYVAPSLPGESEIFISVMEDFAAPVVIVFAFPTTVISVTTEIPLQLPSPQIVSDVATTTPAICTTPPEELSLRDYLKSQNQLSSVDEIQEISTPVRAEAEADVAANQCFMCLYDPEDCETAPAKDSQAGCTKTNPHCEWKDNRCTMNLLPRCASRCEELKLTEKDCHVFKSPPFTLADAKKELPANCTDPVVMRIKHGAVCEGADTILDAVKVFRDCSRKLVRVELYQCSAARLCVNLIKILADLEAEVKKNHGAVSILGGQCPLSSTFAGNEVTIDVDPKNGVKLCIADCDGPNTIGCFPTPGVAKWGWCSRPGNPEATCRVCKKSEKLAALLPGEWQEKPATFCKQYVGYQPPALDANGCYALNSAQWPKWTCQGNCNCNLFKAVEGKTLNKVVDGGKLPAGFSFIWPSSPNGVSDQSPASIQCEEQCKATKEYVEFAPDYMNNGNGFTCTQEVGIAPPPRSRPGGDIPVPPKPPVAPMPPVPPPAIAKEFKCNADCKVTVELLPNKNSVSTTYGVGQRLPAASVADAESKYKMIPRLCEGQGSYFADVEWGRGKYQALKTEVLGVSCKEYVAPE